MSPEMTYDEQTGYYKPTAESTVLMYDVNMSADWSYEITVADISKCEAGADLSKHISIILGDENGMYLRFTIKRRTSEAAHVIEIFDGKPSQKTWQWRDNGNYFGTDGMQDCKIKIAYKDGKYTLSVNGVADADCSEMTIDTFGANANVKVGVYTGQSATAKDWDFVG